MYNYLSIFSSIFLTNHPKPFFPSCFKTEYFRLIYCFCFRTNVASYKAFHTRACDIDEKVKDIRSLVLAQVKHKILFTVADVNSIYKIKQHNSINI